MSHSTNPQDAKPATSQSELKDEASQDQQPESGAIDREERMSIRQSSPTNPRVSEKPEENQEEA